MNEKQEKHPLLTLFLTMFSISAVTFGGGFVIVTFMKRRFVDQLHYITEEEMLDMTALAQSCPGAIAVNAAILAGRRVAGTAGMICAVAGTVLPPLLILSVISLFYSAFSSSTAVRWVLGGMQCGVAVIILDAAWKLGRTVMKEKRWLPLAVTAASFVCAFVLRINVVLVLLAAALIGVLWAVFRKKEGQQA